MTTDRMEPTSGHDEQLSDDVQAVAEYRWVSVLAVVAMLLGVLSLAAVFTSALLFLPLLGVLVAVLAIRRIDASGGLLAGRALAVLGLVLSLAIGTGVFVRGMVVERIIVDQAQQWGLEWCELVRQGELTTALELKRPPASRRVFDESLDEYYQQNDAAREALEEFREHPVIELLQNAPEGARLEVGDVTQMAQDSAGNFTVLQSFELIGAGDFGPATTTPFRLELRKVRYSRAGDLAWMLREQAMGLE